MGILRTNTLSGLETPTPVTGSVSFDGNGDYLSLASSGDFAWGTGDFTWETWVYSTASDHTTGNHYIFDLGGGNIAAMSFYENKFNYYNTTIGLNGQLGTFSANRWTHLAVSRKNQVSYIFVDGILQGSISDAHNYGTTALVAKVGVYAANNTLGWEGYISNLRVLKGTALYTGSFTPPSRELQPIGDTVLLCCNNSTSATAEATGKTITVNGNAVASTFSPGLVRDFTYGTQFDGVSRFDTQGYFVPPSGNTQNRYTLGLNEIVTSGLVLHLDAGNPFSYPVTGVGTKWTDITHTSNGVNNLILYNGTSYSDSNRGFLSFDGVDDYAEGSCNSIINNPSLNNMVISVNFWCNVKTSGSYYVLASGAQTSSTGIAFSYQAGDPFYAIRGTSSQIYKYFNASNFPLNTWVNWCFVSNGTTSILYKNGIQLTSDNIVAGGSPTPVYNTISIGRPNGLSAYSANMNFSTLAIYSKALSAAEVSQNYEALKGRYGLP